MAITWKLTPGMRRMMTQRFDLYAPARVNSGGELGDVGVRLVAANVPGFVGPKTDASDVVVGLGRSPRDQMDTTDEVYLPQLRDNGQKVTVADQWCVRVVQDDDEDWLQMSGEGQALPVRGGETLRFLARKVARPTVVTP